MTTKRKTQDQFVSEVEALFPSKYLFHLVDYKGSKFKVDIVCKLHGVFSALPGNILANHGCAKCSKIELGNRFRFDTATFIAKATEKHGDRYLYESEYIDANTHVSVTCRVHGKFNVMPSSHIAGRNCMKCVADERGLRKRSSLQEFISEANKLHGFKYDYSRVNYTTGVVDVEIVCTIHGSFFVPPARHLNKAKNRGGCQACSKIDKAIASRHSTDQFVSDSIAIHGNKYEYHKVEYVSAKTPITLVCKVHGDFSTTPSSHKQGTGCQLCSAGGYKYNIPGNLYVLRCGDMTKVGITNKTVKARASAISSSFGAKFEILHSYHFTNGAHASEIETILLRELRATHKQPSAKFDGSTECFISVDLPKLTDKILSYIKQLPSSITKKETLP